ncbi:DUF2584 domain-containing protein [Halomicronema hongdechloris]|uniref:DUF2584 domain-containing protein n=1 Tax=Halomicronema hongdechloris TaxID=1209493 RepID=UPI00211B2FB6|nr:DUF2584 domain-containing protein [Halomicronema hongdechloris]
MPCEVNSILKIRKAQGYPENLDFNKQYEAQKDGYRIFPVDVPIPLVNEEWVAFADIKIIKLTWERRLTRLTFEIDRIYRSPFAVKE